MLLGLFLDHEVLLLALARAGVVLGILSAHGESLAVTEPAIAADVHEALDIQLHFRAQRTFELQFGKIGANGSQFFVGELVCALIKIYFAFRKDSPRGRTADAVNVSQRDFDALIARNVNSCKTGHGMWVLESEFRAHAVRHYRVRLFRAER
jgi:hypothetical protein